MANMTTVANVLKRIQQGGVERQQNLKHKSIDLIAKSSKKYNAGGQGFFGAINDYGNESGGAQSESEAFRTIDSENYQQYKVLPKVLVWPIEVTGLMAEAADSDEESFADAVLQEVESAKERLLADSNRQFFGIGTGALCSPAGNVISTALSFSVDSAQYLRKNMVVDVFNGATKTVDSKRISNVDKINNVVYFATSLSVALITTDVMIKENIRDSAASDGKETMGLRGIVDDGTDLTTFENLDASSLLEWRGVRTSASSANLTSDMLQRLLDDVDALSGEEPDTIIMNKKQRRKYLDIVAPEKRYMDQKLDAGHSKLSFNGIDLFLDKDCQDDTVYAINRKHIHKYEVSPLKMGGVGDAPEWLRATGYDKYEAFWRQYINYGTDRRNCHGKIVSLARPSGISG
jgi:hypothetical protein